MSSRIERMYSLACEQYAEHGVDASAALKALDEIAISINAWQGDDVVGFEETNHALTGGCQVTGNYPGRARTADEVRSDLSVALELIPGRHRVNLQSHQVDKMIPGVDRDGFTIEHYASWLDWTKANGLGLDIAPAFYSHPKLDHGLSLSHPDPGIRKFWIDHGKAIRRVAAEFGRALGTPSVVNFWAPDGYKDTPSDRYAARKRLLESLDECMSEPLDDAVELDAVEAKLFGIGTESCTVGSNDFYLTYAAKRNILVCLDSGHFHPTESVADKISAICCQQGRLLLHVSRGVRWDSDHVLVVNDELLSIAREVVAYDYLDRIHIGLDYFDASINRVAAWVIGARNMQKALLIGLLEPKKRIDGYENAFDFTSRLALQEEAKALPWCAVWDYYCETQGVPVGFGFMDRIRSYEKAVQFKREG